MDLEPAWLSTVAHVTRFSEIAVPPRLIYRLPPGFPQTLVYGLFPAPLIMIASGRLLLADDRMHFEALPPRFRFFAPIRNLRTDVSFDLAGDQLSSVESYDFRSPIYSDVVVPFVRVRSRAAGLAGDFLVCRGGGYWDQDGMSRDSQRLLAEMTALMKAGDRSS